MLYLKYVVMKNLQSPMKICRNTCLFFFASVIMNAGDFMKRIVIKENKILLIVGIIDALFFGFCLIFSIIDAISSHDLVQIVLCGVIFGSFTFLGIGLILDALLRCIVITQKECYSRSFYGVKKYFNYTDISYCLMNIKNNYIQYCLYCSNHQKLASFEDNMIGSKDLISHFMKHNIPIQKKYSHTFQTEKTKTSMRSHGNSLNQQQMKKRLRILKIICVVLMLVSLFYFNHSIKLMIYLIIPLIWYGLYIYFYPTMFFDTSSESSYLGFPYIIVGIDIIVLLKLSYMANIQNMSCFFWMIAIMTIVLFVPFLIVYHHSKKLTRLLGVVMALMVYSFVSCYSWNWLFCKDIIHEQVQVVDFKEIHTTKGGSSYYLYIDTSQQKHVKLECSKNIYENAKQTHHVVLCQRKSIFDISYWNVHL